MGDFYDPKVIAGAALLAVCMVIGIYTLTRLFCKWAYAMCNETDMDKNYPPGSGRSLDECNHDHEKWRLDTTKDIVRLKNSRPGPGQYEIQRNMFLSAFERNDQIGMEKANDMMKEIENKAGIVSDVNIIERIMLMKGIVWDNKPKNR